MDFQIGDKVIHRTHGLGDVVRIEEKIIRDHITNCYVVQTSNLQVWIPIDNNQIGSLRVPTPPEEFRQLVEILTTPPEPLLDDRLLRKDQLMGYLNDGQLSSLFRAVRDLNSYKRKTKLNDQEKIIMERAMNTLLAEWAYSLGVSLEQAQLEMAQLLGA